MNERVQSTYVGASGAGSVAARNTVLRNTYWLLALSLVPTVLGAWLGVSSGITRSMGTGMSLIVFFGGAFAFIWGIERNKNSGLGVALLLGFTFFMGLMLSRLIASVLGFSNGAQLVAYAFGTTGVVFAAMATLASVIKRDLSGMGKFLAVGAVLLLVALLLNIFFKSDSLDADLVGAGCRPFFGLHVVRPEARH